ncbi:MAG: AAA family ATPase, partial [Euryarchaeota archaeon]|nr:AAA family ATPase [Euryarchaeota archaeon]
FTPKNNWLIVDEINRADIDKAFGSLFSALTGDNITLSFEIAGKPVEIIGDPTDGSETSDNVFIIHPDWRIIATMNTFDKTSLYEMSYAFMRRFAFIQVTVPSKIDENLISEYVRVWGFERDAEIYRTLSELWKIINEYRKIGPAVIEDIYKHLLEEEDYVSAVTMYVMPQFEGMLEKDQKEFIKELSGKDFIKDEDRLKDFASEFFGIERTKFEKEGES